MDYVVLEISDESQIPVTTAGSVLLFHLFPSILIMAYFLSLTEDYLNQSINHLFNLKKKDNNK